MTWREELRRKDPALARDYDIAGWGQNAGHLRNMVRALKMMRAMNTDEEEARLAAAQRILRKRPRRSNPRRHGRRNSGRPSDWRYQRSSSEMRKIGMKECPKCLGVGSTTHYVKSGLSKARCSKCDGVGFIKSTKRNPRKRRYRSRR